jgi:hypothetical protein
MNGGTKMDTVEMMAVKYRTIIGQSKEASLAVFPAPHQYFYPLDNCYNLEHIWYGENYRNLFLVLELVFVTICWVTVAGYRGSMRLRRRSNAIISSVC